MAIMQAPGSVAPGSIFTLPLSLVAYTVDTNGFVQVSSQQDINSLIREGFALLWGGRNTFSATLNPAANSDVTKDYAPGSIWINQAVSPPKVWMCVSSATGAAVWAQMSFGDNVIGSGTAVFVNLVLSGLLTNSSSSAVSAFSGGGQGSATLLASIYNNITTASASSAPYDSVRLQPGTTGLWQIVFNATSNPVQLFTTGSDTINGHAGNVGMTLQAGGIVQCFCVSTGVWSANGNGLSFLNNRIYHSSSATSGFTLTAAQVSGGAAEVYFDFIGTLAANASAQLPTVAALVGLIPNIGINQTYKLRVINNSAGAYTWTLTTNTGWTLNGPMTIDQGGWRDFLVRFDTLTTAILQSLGGSGGVSGMGFATSDVYNTNSSTSGTTLTAANISGARDEVTLNMTGALGGAANAQLPLVSDLVAAIPDPVAGQSYRLRIINSSSGAFAWTVTTNSGWTLTGTMTIAKDTFRDFYITLTSLAAAVLQQRGTGTNS